MIKNTILAFIVSFILGCTNSPHISEDNAYSKKYKGVGKQRQILLLPVNNSINYFSDGDAVVSRNIVTQLELHGWLVVTLNKSIYEKEWSRIIKEIGGVYSPTTGHLDTDKYYDSLVKLTKKVSKERAYSAILIPSFELKAAKLKGKYAHWDGVKRKKITEGSSSEGMRWSGSTKGLSLKIWAFDSKGEWLFTSYGGLVLPFYTSMYNSKVENKLRVDMFKNSKDIESGVNVALLPIILEDRIKLALPEK